jgi:hypothetical protein
LDDPRFDSITRALASGQSRRGVWKAVLAIVGGMTDGAGLGSANAARRPTPTPKPVTCPGQQVWDGAACDCPTGEKCGPACCPAEASCCDNACCYGTCYAEELCCPSPREWCPDSGECCPDGWSCCPGFGCIEDGLCCSDADCPQSTCAESACLENHICSEPIPNCNLGGGAECCGENEVCHADGTCLPASITVEFVSGGAGFCQPAVVLAGFLPNTTYGVGFGGFRGDLPINPIGRQLTTDQSGGFASTFNVAFLNGMDQAVVTVENVSSGLVPVIC